MTPDQSPGQSPAGDGAELSGRLQAMLAAVLHDLRDPLTVISATAQILARRYPARLPADDGRQLAAGLTRIQEESRRLARWIDELSDLSRLQLGQDLPLDRQSVDLVQLAGRVTRELQRATDLHVIRLLAPDGPIVGQWDEGRLERVLVNLVTNAIKYSPAGGEVRLAVCLLAGDESSPATDWAELRVSDAGIGIPAEAQSRIFEPFYRAPNAMPVSEGSGLGLVSVRHIVERHGGTVTVHSEVASGSTFVVRLPLAIADS